MWINIDKANDEKDSTADKGVIGWQSDAGDMTHPIEHFHAPRSITAGKPLKNLMDDALIQLIADSFIQVWPTFDIASFVKKASAGIEALELQDRGRQIGAALHLHLPDDFSEALPLFIKALGPPLDQSGDIGMRPFFYLPHSHYLSVAALSQVEEGLDACYQLTKRFTSEFCIRPLIEKDSVRVMARLHEWVADPDCHVRRLVSEGTRPRLPWASCLPQFIKDPGPVLELLNRLSGDPSLYVRRSVANNLGDIAKDHLSLALDTCERWLRESECLDISAANDLRWVIRHALRYPDKKGDPRAHALRVAAGGRRGSR